MQTRKKCRRRHSRKHGGGLFSSSGENEAGTGLFANITAKIDSAKNSVTGSLNQAESTLQNTQSSVIGNVQGKIAEAKMLATEKANSAIDKAKNAVNQTESPIASGGKKHKRSHTSKRSHINKRKRKSKHKQI